MIVLLDTDVLIDIALDRAPHAETASNLLRILEKRPGTAFVAWHSLSNFYYVTRRILGSRGARQFIRGLVRFVGVAPTTTHHLLQVIELEMKDFEDALQVAAAIACRANVIVTRNSKDFKASLVRVANPQSVLNDLGSNGRWTQEPA